ncbi:hypothetical protein [Pontimicrobium sp. MEBiC01747]
MKIALITGPKKSGKTTTISLLYSKLFDRASEHILLNGNSLYIPLSNLDEIIKKKDNGDFQEFKAEFMLNSKKIAFISKVNNDFKTIINVLKARNVKILFCCIESNNIEKLAMLLPGKSKINEYKVSYIQDEKDKYICKQGIIKQMIEDYNL